MSADTPDAKYGADLSRHCLQADIGVVAFSDHALHRWNERAPHECPTRPREAFRRGEWVRHPSVAHFAEDVAEPAHARVYKHNCPDGSEWGVVWPVVAASSGEGEWVAVTTVALAGVEHGPSKNYLHSHGPHVVEDSR